MRKLALLLFIFSNFLGYSQSVKSAISTLQKDKDLKNSSIAISAVDVKTGAILVDENSDLAVIPASVQKLFTTATALEKLGEDYRFETTLAYSGKLNKKTGVLHGDLYLIGGNDPALASDLFPSHYSYLLTRWISEIKDLGIDSIQGRIIADVSSFDEKSTPDTWIWGDIGNYFGASPSGLSVYENMLKLYFNSSKTSGHPTELVGVFPQVPGLTIDNGVMSGNINNDEAYIYGGPNEMHRKAIGEIPKNKTEFLVKASLPNPPLSISLMLESALREQGIFTQEEPLVVYEKKEGIHYKEIDVVQSPRLINLTYWTNMKSVNLFAEHLNAELAKDSLGQGNVEIGAKIVTDFWESKGMNIDGLNLLDGSGLSRFNTLTTRQLTTLLTYMYSSKNFESFYKSLPLAGRSGSLINMCKGTFAENNLSAKSGYMERVRSYSGYVTSKTGKKIAFAIVVNNYNCSAYQMKKKLEKVLIAFSEM